MDNETIYSKGDNFVETEVDEEIILMNLEDGHFFSLVSTSRRIWKLLDNIQTLQNLVTPYVQNLMFLSINASRYSQTS